MKKKISDTDRLKSLVEIFDQGGSSDFDQMLFFAKRKRKTIYSSFRLALNQWIKDGR